MLTMIYNCFFWLNISLLLLMTVSIHRTFTSPRCCFILKANISRMNCGGLLYYFFKGVDKNT